MKNLFRTLVLSRIRRAWDRFRLRAVTRAGNDVRLRGKVVIINAGTMVIGDRVIINGFSLPSQIKVEDNGYMEIGDDSFINVGTTIGACGEVRIGKRVMIACLVTIMDSDYHGLEDRKSRPKPKPVIIEDDVWIGVKAIVLKGVRIGARSVVAAGSIVTNDVPPDTLVAGIPAKPIRKLNQAADA